MEEYLLMPGGVNTDLEEAPVTAVNLPELDFSKASNSMYLGVV